MWKWLLKMIKVDEIIHSLIKGIIVSILMEIKNELTDKTIEDIEENLREKIEARTKSLPTEWRPIIEKALEPILVLLINALKYTDDAAGEIAKIIEKIG